MSCDADKLFIPVDPKIKLDFIGSILIKISLYRIWRNSWVGFTVRICVDLKHLKKLNTFRIYICIQHSKIARNTLEKLNSKSVTTWAVA